MTLPFRFLLATGAAFAVPLAAAPSHHAHEASPVEAGAIGGNGQPLGTVRAEQTHAGVLLSVDLSGLPAGELGIHLHEKGLCEPGNAFATAGAHLVTLAKAHGFRDAKGPHAGDMPNLFVAADGKARAQMLNPAVSLGTGANSLGDADGSALVVHAGPDDYASQPAGGSGQRIACAVIAPPAR